MHNFVQFNDELRGCRLELLEVRVQIGVGSFVYLQSKLESCLLALGVENSEGMSVEDGFAGVVRVGFEGLGNF